MKPRADHGVSGDQNPWGKDPERELVTIGPGRALRCFTHDYPHPLARWHFHPETEIHLISASAGTAYIGSTVRVFEPGSVFMVGRNVPHHWVSAISEGQVVPGRDVLVQVDEQVVHGLIQLVPELTGVGELMASSAFGLEFLGESRKRAAQLLQEIQETEGVRRFTVFVQLLCALADAPASERIVVDPLYSADLMDADEAESFDSALTYICENLGSRLTLAEVAQHLRRSPAVVSRLFTRATTVGFSRTVTRLRVSEACRLLRTTQRSIGQICWDAGFANLSNFNRRFKEETGMTPRQYRSSRGAAGSGHSRGESAIIEERLRKGE